MGGSSGGLTDTVEIHIPEWEARTINDWIGVFPSCPACGKKMTVRDSVWKGGWKPRKIGCPDKSCKLYYRGGLKANEW